MTLRSQVEPAAPVSGQAPERSDVAFFRITFHPPTGGNWSVSSRIVEQQVEVRRLEALATSWPPSGVSGAAAAGCAASKGINHMLPESKWVPWCWSHTPNTVRPSAVSSYLGCLPRCCPLPPTGALLPGDTFIYNIYLSIVFLFPYIPGLVDKNQMSQYV